jgi:hypothetical protein
MKIACSSATFAREMRAGDLTLLDWLDVCANELEVDGVVVGAAHLARTDDDYLAQMKKAAADLGLTVAALESEEPVGPAFAPGILAAAVALGAPVLVVRAPPAAEDPSAWGAFTDALKALASAAKAANVTLGLRNVPESLCPAAADLPRVAKDVDSSWLRFAFDAATSDAPAGVLAKSVISTYTIERLDTFGTRGDPAARTLIARLARFRGFVTLASDDPAAAPDEYHRALERFAAERANALSSSAFVSAVI